MADDVAITAGVGTVIATDDVSSRHFQIVKLGVGADGSTPASVAEQAPLPVKAARLETSDFSEVAINCASSGDNQIVAATASQIIRVWAFFLKVNGSAGVSLKWRSAANDLHPALPFFDKTGWILAPMGRAWFTCTVAEALNLNLSAAIQVSGRLYYTKNA